MFQSIALYVDFIFFVLQRIIREKYNLLITLNVVH